MNTFGDDPRLTIIAALSIGVPTVSSFNIIVLPVTVSSEVEMKLALVTFKLPEIVTLPVNKPEPVTCKFACGVAVPTPKELLA